MAYRRAFAPSLWNVGWRFLLRHAWQSALMVFGVALGVAVVISIDLANASAKKAFELSAQTLTGKATHQVNGGPQGIAEDVYVTLKKSGWPLPAAPVVSEYVTSPQLGNRPLQLLGIDPFADAPFRSFFGEGGGVPTDGLAAFFSQPGAVLLSRAMAERYGLAIASMVDIVSGGRARTAFVAGLLEPADRLSQRSLDGVMLADIASAQELTGTEGFISQIDLILPADVEHWTGLLAQRLPAGLSVSRASARSDALEQMTEAFRVNLTALSLLALMVGLFLITTR